MFEGARDAAKQRLRAAMQKRLPPAIAAALYDLAREQAQAGEAEAALQTYEQLRLITAEINVQRPGMVTPDMQVELAFGAALAALRKAENENCVHCADGQGCLFPIGKNAVHQQRDGSELAIKHLQRVLEIDPDHASAAWLLNVAHMTLGSYPEGVPERFRMPIESTRSPAEFPHFFNVAGDVGVDTFSLAGGVIADDFDGDHDLDLFVSSWATDGPCRYFENVGGPDGFVDRTSEANLDGIVGGLNLAAADFDNDGDVDVLVLRGAWLRRFGDHPNSLLRNDGGRFVDIAYDVGLAGNDFPTQTATIADYDRDGDLDIYFGNEIGPNRLMRNDRDRFVDVADAAGVADAGFCKGVTFGDVDNDGDVDLYVSNLKSGNRLFINDGEGRFDDGTTAAGVAEPNSSFSTWFFDYDNDGNQDLFVAYYDDRMDEVAESFLHQGIPRDSLRLYRGNGDGTFQDVSNVLPQDRVVHTMGSNYGDLDGDGYEDLYLATGFPGLEALQPNLMFRNRGGESFEDISIAGGFSHLQKGHAVAFGDFDHDGDNDVFVELGGAFAGDGFHNALFQNPGMQPHWIKMLCVGTESPRDSTGAHVRVRIKSKTDDRHRTVHRTVSRGSSFGGNPLRLNIGLAEHESVAEVEVRWPTSGDRQRFDGLQRDRLWVLTEGQRDPQPIELTPFAWAVKDRSL